MEDVLMPYFFEIKDGFITGIEKNDSIKRKEKKGGILMTLLKMSFYGAVIILAILIIRAFTLHKLPKKTFLILWAVALVHLLVPFEIASGFSLYSLLPEALVVGEQTDNLTQNTEQLNYVL